MRGEEAVFGACLGPCRRRFVRDRGLGVGFLRVCGVFSPMRSGTSPDRDSKNRIIVRERAGDLEVAGGLGGPGRALGA